MTPFNSNEVSFVATNPDGTPLNGKVTIRITDPGKGKFPLDKCQSATECTVDVSGGEGTFPLIPLDPGADVPVTLTIDATGTTTSGTIPVAEDSVSITDVGGNPLTTPLTPNEPSEVNIQLCAAGSVATGDCVPPQEEQVVTITIDDPSKGEFPAGSQCESATTCTITVPPGGKGSFPLTPKEPGASVPLTVTNTTTGTSTKGNVPVLADDGACPAGSTLLFISSDPGTSGDVLNAYNSFIATAHRCCPC